MEKIQTPDLSPLGRLCVWGGGLSCRNPDDDCTASSVSSVNKTQLLESAPSHDLKIIASLKNFTKIFELHFV